MLFLANVYSGKRSVKKNCAMKTYFKKFLMKRFLTEEEYNEVYGNGFIEFEE